MSLPERFRKLLFPRYYKTFKPIDYEESVRILDTDCSNIMDRYRNLMKINHPDKGGSIYICAKINEAKNYLLEDKKKIYK